LNAPEVRAGLEACPLFADVVSDPPALDHLVEICTLERARSGDVVIREGSEGDAFYVILSGRVRTEKLTPSHDPYTVASLVAGSFFGELSLLDRDIRSATVVAEADCDLLVITRDRFLAFGDRWPGPALLLTRRLAERVARRLRRANEDVVTLFGALVHEVEQRI
jgi:CRP/FNR family transcriptional regulator, cyclic AMP receptor protein